MLLRKQDLQNIIQAASSKDKQVVLAELVRLFQAAGIFHYDTIAISGTSIKQIDLTKTAQYFSRYDLDLAVESEEEKGNLLIDTDILTENGETSISGLRYCGKLSQMISNWVEYIVQKNDKD